MTGEAGSREAGPREAGAGEAARGEAASGEAGPGEAAPRELAPGELEALLRRAFARRAPLVSPHHDVAFRAFHGPTEGLAALSVDVYGSSLVLSDRAGEDGDEATARLATRLAREVFPFLRAALWKVRRAIDPARRAGVLLEGGRGDLARKVRESDVRYALALDAGKDASLYLDTRELRAHLARTMAGASVLNTFAYTGSLGVAARAGGARRVVHVDRSREALGLAKTSYAMNGLEVRRADFVVGDVFAVAAQLRRKGELFDAVIVDPPFFSDTGAGRVDLVEGTTKLLGKLRPLVADGGALVVVNNALFLPGAELDRALGEICGEGFAELERRIGVPEDCAGYADTRVAPWPADPAPWDHPTKIAILRVRRKDGRKAS